MSKLSSATVLLLAILIPLTAARGPGQLVRFESRASDSLALASSYYYVDGAKAPLALILHGLGDDPLRYRTLAAALQRNGVAAWLPDLRGHGESVFTPRGRILRPEVWDRKMRDQLADDLGIMLEVAGSQRSLTDGAWLLVASVEAIDIALDLADRDERFKWLVLVSPVTAPRQDLPAANYFLFACEGDSLSAKMVRELYLALPEENRRMNLLPGRRRGSGILRVETDLGRVIADWHQTGGQGSR